MKDILVFAKEILLERMPVTGTFIDFTMGNGHDTLYFAQYLEQGHVYAFDIQPQAVENTRRLLKEYGVLHRATLIHDSHSNVDKYVQGEIDAGVFNLGYLPGSDKTVTTLSHTTLIALEKAVNMLKIGGVIVVVIYPGHGEGAKEAQLVEEFCAQLDKHTYNSYKYNLLNKKNPPYIVAVERFVPANRYKGRVEGCQP